MNLNTKLFFCLLPEAYTPFDPIVDNKNATKINFSPKKFKKFM